MKKKIAIIAALVLVIGLSVFGVNQHEKAYAKQAQMQLEVPGSIKKENEFKVKVTVDSDVDLYSVDAYLSYDASLLEFVPDGDAVTGSGGVLELKDTYAEETRKAEYEITFKALDTGKTEISFSEIYLIDYADMDYMEVVPSARSFDIGVNKTVATDARLSELLVAPGELTQEFDPNQLDYEMHVGMDVEMVGLSATPMDEGSVVESDIPDKLVVGKNVITIRVTALSGNVNEYTIVVYREELEMTSEETEEITTESEQLQQDAAEGETTEPDTSERKDEGTTETVTEAIEQSTEEISTEASEAVQP